MMTPLQAKQVATMAQALQLSEGQLVRLARQVSGDGCMLRDPFHLNPAQAELLIGELLAIVQCEFLHDGEALLCM
jgi:hypothetical protein